MAGHSKWANIKHRKGKQDALKGKVFAKLIREITVAAKQSADAAINPRLRLAVEKALMQNMSRDTIDRAINRGSGSNDLTNLEEIVYEGYAPGGVAVLVYCLTDNRNRTAGEVRHAFSKHGGNLGTSGSVAYLFKQRGVICFSAEKADEEKLMQLALAQEAEDLVYDDDGFEIITPYEKFFATKAEFEATGITPELAEISMVPVNRVLLDEELSLKVLALTEALELLDDVQNVYTNAELSTKILEG